ncbi:hypothetical protein HMSSN036_87370 [Paenibacillus macerans]|nr:hypothetical protein HMSSN036_87370 [Paenibacillus macerans]
MTDEEAKLILDGDGSSYKREGGYNAVISKRLLIGWSGHGHSAVDVGVWAYGPIADKVKGQIDNTQIAFAGAEVLGVDLQRRRLSCNPNMCIRNSKSTAKMKCSIRRRL